MSVVVLRARPVALLAALLASALLASCGNTTEPTMQSLVGRYHVRTIDGALLPWRNPNRVKVASDTEKVTSVELQLLPDGTAFEQWSTWIAGVGGAVAGGATQVGTFSVAGSNVAMTLNGPFDTYTFARASGPASSDGLTVTTDDGRVIVYVKDP